ncbi:heme-degrading domain-containing protein [Neorhizobium sp. NCHU2750]|uniref:heme-degrading domain-containing protein n=1 Tax=Neorhizobium sp. NCHU2750 TaxID=1825976 RepID=UPI000E721A94|nr:hypothetical protein NCHU2750_18410 [Neorhizobium sp. NCHU2750]
MSFDEDIATIAEQERVLVFDEFNADTAWVVGSRLRAVAAERGLAVAIDITCHSMPMFYCALPGSTADNARWVRRKRNVVMNFFRSSYGIGRQLARDETTVQARYGLADADYATHGGSFPITVSGTGCIGAITVSGLPQREDHNLVVSVLCEILGRDEQKIALAP